ncbi:MAG TPA: hypothetical protein VFR36_05360 [Sphingomicrobium sp.]|nr:hypothetical protein [Sphingomicrobium sp.]
MGAHVPEMEPVENASAEALLSSLPTISAVERRKHASVFNYWLSIRGDRQFPPIRDLDPLEISDAGPWSILLEMIGGGDDAVVRHLGQAVKAGMEVEKIGEAPSPSLLASIHNKLPIVAACRQAFAFEESFEADNGKTRCWVTLLPFSANGTWIDYVYGFVSLDPAPGVEAEPVEDEGTDDVSASAEDTTNSSTIPLRPFFDEGQAAGEVVEPASEAEAASEPEPAFEPELDAQPAEETCENASDEALMVEPESEPESEAEPEPVEQTCEFVDEDEPAAEPVTEKEAEPEPEAVIEPEAALEQVGEAAPTKPGFSAKLFEKLGSVTGFYGQGVEAPPLAPTEAAEEAPPMELSVEEESVSPSVAEEESTPIESSVVEEPVAPSEIVAEPEIVQPAYAMEGSLQDKLTEVRAKADEARLARLRSVAALIEGLSAAYDFALDAEQAPEEYLKLVEAQGLKIQLRAPMKPVVKLAFEGSCDDETIAELEAVMAWALKQELPRGALVERIEAEGGIGSVLEGLGRAA